MQSSHVIQSSDNFRRLRQFVHKRLIDSIESGGGNEMLTSVSMRKHIDTLIRQVEDEAGKPIAADTRIALGEEVFQEVNGLGPLAALMIDSGISDILINGPDEVWVDRSGVLGLTEIRFDDEAHLRRFLDRLISQQGKHLDANNPTVDARLPDGSRLHAMIPPLCARGPVVSIRRFTEAQSSPEVLLENGMLSKPMLDLLSLAVVGGMNIVITGGAASGKTTLLNGISGFIPVTERVVTVEESSELQLRHPHVVTLETRQGNSEGRGVVDLRTLLRHALRMRADRIIVGEVRGNEVFEMLQAMTVGHDGSLSTLHSTSPADALKRLESLALLADVGLPREAIRDIIGSAVQLVVQIARFRDGSRCVTSICEVKSKEGKLSATEVFRFKADLAEDSNEAADVRPLNRAGEHLACDVPVRFVSALRERGFQIPASLEYLLGKAEH